MSSRRSSVGVGVLGGLLYAVGGYDGASRHCLSSVECYNPVTKEWSLACDMSTRRSGAGVGVSFEPVSSVSTLLFNFFLVKAMSHDAIFLTTCNAVLLLRCKLGKYASLLHFANVFFTYQTVFTS